MPSREHGTETGWWVCVPGLFEGEWHRMSGPYASEQAARDYAAQFCAIWKLVRDA